MNSKLALFPEGSTVNEKGHLVVGGCDTVGLAAEFGTPVYVFDEANLRRRCAEFLEAFGAAYPGTRVVYACKAFIDTFLAHLINEEGLGADVVSGGEISVLQHAHFPMSKVVFHGNNKSAAELKLALELGVGRIVVDNFYEMEMLAGIARETGKRPRIMLRLSPGVMAHTHKYVITGAPDSKFGFPMSQADDAVARALGAPELELMGLHFHVGSAVFEIEPYEQAIDVITDFAARMKRRHGFAIREMDAGGGFAVQYEADKPAPPAAFYAEKISSRLKTRCQENDLPLPALTVEPGRAIVARAGLALYRVGSAKEIPGLKSFIAIDGGMADNIRPALYGSHHEPVVASRMNEKPSRRVSIAGKFCESGDILAEDVDLPPAVAGDIIAVADCGAYCLPMASNYNASLKPPVVVVRDGQARLIRRGETYEDLFRNDLV